MAKIKVKGKAGAAKNYVTRNQALKKLQLTLADFRRLCILKGIFPRQPRSVKKAANKGSSALATFYYAKDVAFLQHEPILRTLREHKAFAKKLARAIGRKEWHAAKNLDDNKPVYKLNHIVKERYPTFSDSLKDLDDALSLLTLFANLPANDKISSEIIATCARLCAEWQLYIMKTKSLKKVFLSIKGIYFQAEVRGETVTWLVPYMFTQHIPTDVDFRIMFTFLELYQTVVGFVLFKLYSDENLVYPPKFDQDKDGAGAGFGALSLDPASAAVLKGENTSAATNGSNTATTVGKDGKKISAKDVKKQIRAITHKGIDGIPTEDQAEEADESITTGTLAKGTTSDEFVEQQSKSTNLDEASTTSLTTLAQIEAASTAKEGSATQLFSAYVFYISRECPRSVVEFVLRSFGALPGKIGWDMTAGAGSAIDEMDPKITHHIVDRPIPSNGYKKYSGKRVFIQPQWIVDCANARKLLPTEPYGPSKTLPPHLSPFVDDAEIARRGGYIPDEARAQLGLEQDGGEEEDSSDEDDEEMEEDEEEEVEEEGETKTPASKKAKGKNKTSTVDATKRPAFAALLADPTDSKSAGLVDAAELEAEAIGGEDALEEVRTKHATALKEAKKQRKATEADNQTTNPKEKLTEEEAKEMSKMLMSNRQRKLYEKLHYSAGKRAEEKTRLEQKKKVLDKAKKKQTKA